MSAPEGAVSIELEVPFHDVDALQIVWHGRYAKYAELAATALFRARGVDLNALASTGHRMVVMESRCRYAFPLRYGDCFRVSAWFRDLDHRVCIAYELVNLTHGRRSARGHTALVTLDKDGKLLLVTPQALVDKLRG